jgi:Polyketide cyclase / dehydrase and lipid transport
MGRVSANITVPGRAVQAERVWYDPSRWASWIEGFGHVVSLDDSWPRKGSRLLWESPPQGRGRVSERVVAYEMRIGQTLAVEDGRMEATQRVSFEPQPDSVKITLALEYRLKDRNLLTPVVDLLFVRRALGDSLRRTLRRFASELAAERQFGAPR